MKLYSGKLHAPCWCQNLFSLAHAGILHSSMPEMFSGMEKCKMPAMGEGQNVPLLTVESSAILSGWRNAS